MKAHAPGDSNQFEWKIESGCSLKDFFGLFSIPNERCIALINGKRVNEDICFKEGDALVLFPEISGG
ncbi:MAG: hypothetical protein K8S18_21325 [Desulfobacula sp.]|nr:hypothetical protein [Desulfobacula sp.]